MFASVSGITTGSSRSATRSPNIAVEGVVTSGMMIGSGTMGTISSTSTLLITLSSNTFASVVGIWIGSSSLAARYVKGFAGDAALAGATGSGFLTGTGSSTRTVGARVFSKIDALICTTPSSSSEVKMVMGTSCATCAAGCALGRIASLTAAGSSTTGLTSSTRATAGTLSPSTATSVGSYEFTTASSSTL